MPEVVGGSRPWEGAPFLYHSYPPGSDTLCSCRHRRGVLLRHRWSNNHRPSSLKPQATENPSLTYFRHSNGKALGKHPGSQIHTTFPQHTFHRLSERPQGTQSPEPRQPPQECFGDVVNFLLYQTALLANLLCFQPKERQSFLPT